MTALGLLGYNNVRSMMSGLSAWSNAGYPSSQDPVTVEASTAPAIEPAVLEVVDAFMSSIPAGYYTVKAIDLQIELNSATPPVVIDVRTDGEREQGYIDGSVYITLSDIMARMSEWPQDFATPIVVYDNPTHRSTMAITLMRILGYQNVRVLSGGVGAWTKDQLPLTTE
jgi:rhodanese-related sulfurtransferase